MVKTSLKESPFAIYDLIGGGIVLTLIAVGLWSTFIHLPDSSERFKRAQEELSATSKSLRAVERNLSNSNAELASVESEVNDRGALPKSAPVDANLQAITRLIQTNNIELINVDPIDENQYPGLWEHNYKVQCRSGFDSILAFLEDFEAEPFWADLTKLRILGAPASMESGDAAHRAEFVVSLFAASTTSEGEGTP